MLCPRCNVDLEPARVEETPLERCPSCRGVFLDHGELDRITAPHDGDLEYSTLEDDSHVHPDRFGPTACPRCPDSTMVKVEFNIHSGIILDYCESCRGFWVDARELRRIDEEVQELNEAERTGPASAMSWFATFLWSLPR